jgi:WD40 repeat protein
LTKSKILKGHQDWVNSVTFNPTGDRLLSDVSDKTLKMKISLI